VELIQQQINPEFFNYNEEWVNKYIHISAKSAPSRLIVEEVEKYGVLTNIFFMPIFNNLFCNEMVELAKTLPEDIWTTERHPTYPTTDLLLSTINLENVYSSVLRDFMIPLAIDAYELDGTTPEDFFAENFLIRYTPETQNHLPFHHDSSLFTFNVSINDDFTDGGLLFKKNNIHIQPEPGHGVLAPGMIGYKHGAKPISSGVRYMIISFVMPQKPFFRKETKESVWNAFK